MIKDFSIKIVDMLIKHSGIISDEDQRDIYIYGLECLLNTGITIVILSIWGIITHSLFETLSWIAAFSLLRHHIGGLHAPTQFACILCSVLLGISNYLISIAITITSKHMLFAYLFCLTVCLLFAPIETSKIHLAPPMDIQQKIISILIVLLGYFATPILPASISISITHALLCGVFLLLISKLKNCLIQKHFNSRNN